MTKVLCVTGRIGGQLDEAAFELLTAGRELAGDGAVEVAILGAGVGEDAALLARGFDKVFLFDDPRLAAPDAELEGALLRGLVEREAHDVVLLVHGNLALDLVPPLAARLGRPLVADALSLDLRSGRLVATRTVFGGKLHARVSADASQGVVATIRGGAFAAGEPTGAGEVVAESIPAELTLRRRFVRTVEPDAGEVDISSAERLVGVGRGIEEEENLELVQALAAALGGEVACSRPVVDKGWLPKSRQVGTSGVTVKPKVYLAVGISGSFQHVGGIKGAPFVIAVNKDAKAPIFGFADVGVVGDLFDVVPALTEQLKAAKA